MEFSIYLVEQLLLQFASRIFKTLVQWCLRNTSSSCDKSKKFLTTLRDLWYFTSLKIPPNCVTGALCRKTDPKIATAPKTQSRSKDQNDKDKFKVESNGKNLISLSLKASLNKFSRGSLVIRIRYLSL